MWKQEKERERKKKEGSESWVHGKHVFKTNKEMTESYEKIMLEELWSIYNSTERYNTVNGMQDVHQ